MSPEPQPSPPAPAGRSSGRLLAACLLTVVVCSLLASLVQSSWGRVQVVDLKLPMQNGQWLTADLFRPRTATNENKAPLVVVVPGFQRSKESLENVSMELARRGIVAITIDPYAQGGSSSSMTPQSATTEGYGMFAVVDFVADTGILNYVDQTRLGVTGHSAGGNAAILAASYFGREAARTGRPSKLQSVFVSGYVLSMTDKVLRHVRCNVGMSYALYDEGAYRNEMKNGDMRRAPEALRLVNSPPGRAEAPVTEVEIGHYYGTVAESNLRVVHNERMIHPFQPYSITATANQIEYFEKVFGLNSGLASHDQVWFWKELLTLVSLVASFVALVPAAQLLLAHVRFFQPLVHSIPPPQPRAQGPGRVVFWVLLVAGALVACFSYIPLAELSQKLFAEASGREQTWFFPQRMNNAVMLWALLNGLVGFLLFYLGHRWSGQAAGVTPARWGTQTSARELARTAVLALVLFTGFFGLLFGVHYFFQVDYRFAFIGVRVFQPTLLVLLLLYAPAFLPFFLANSLRVNGAMRPAGVPEWRSMLLAGVANSLGLLLIVIVQYAALAATGTVHWTDGWLYINLLFGVVPMMFILPYFNRHFFRLTGRVYLGPLTTCLIFIMILISSTVCYIPL
ncbi:MAG: dienelactone hydrolase family protein [Lacunisphaera sp.]|nr:dienelactone hydrolase family protein [Lacunisphaera sp.]